MTDYRSATVEGTLFPAAGVLGRGERKTVAYTERIARLVAKGRLKVVEFHDPEPEQLKFPETPTDHELPNDVFVPAEPPKRNASREDWAEFLAIHHGVITEGKSRDELLDEWDALNEPSEDLAP